MALIGQEHVIKIHFLSNEQVTSQYKDLTSQHKDLTSRHNYLTSDGRNMPPYLTDHVYAFLLDLSFFLLHICFNTE